MGNAAGKGGNINQKLRARAAANADVFKLLLLGAGESGKSTILRQVTLKYGGGFDASLRRAYRTKILFSLLTGTKTVMDMSAELGWALADDPQARPLCDVVTRYVSKADGELQQMPADLAKAINALKNFDAFKKTLKESHQYQLEDTFVDFVASLENYPTWGGSSWLPNDDDMLRARVRTTGVVHEAFTVDNQKFEMIDVGGQRAERRKWINLFNSVSGVLFVTALSEYNQVLFEDSTVNRLHESLYLWRDHANKAEFKDSALVLFFNKFDLFQQKYYVDGVELINPVGNGEKVPVREDETDAECQKALQWFEMLFLAQVDPGRREEVFTHVTTALNTNQMQAVIEACSTFILQRSLIAAGLMERGDRLKSY